MYKLGLTALLLCGAFLTGCNATDEEKELLKEAQVDLEQLADQIIITYPVNGAIIDSPSVTVRADIPASAEAQEVTLYVDGVEIAKDSDGAPWEIEWPTYYWADGSQHTLLLKTVTGGGNEVRNNQQYQVSVSSQANQLLSLSSDLNDLEIRDKDTLLVEYTTLPDATTYEISYTTNGREETITSASNNATITGLKVGQYQIKYRAIKELSNQNRLNGAWSDEKTIEVLAPHLPALSTPIVTNSASGYNIEISWDDLGEGNTYTTYINNSNQPNEVTTHQITNSSTLLLSNLSAGEYEFQFKRTNAFGHVSATSDTLIIEAGVFQRKFGGNGEDIAKQISTTNSGEYIVLASTTSFGDSNGDDWIFKLNGSGTREWEILHSRSGAPRINGFKILNNGNILGFGLATSTVIAGNLILISPEGIILWEEQYINPNANRQITRGVTEKDGNVYALIDMWFCDDLESNCNITPALQLIDTNSGASINTIQIENLEGAVWDGVSSLNTTQDGELLVGFAAKKQTCGEPLDCVAAGVATVTAQGEINFEWNSFTTGGFYNGSHAAELASGEILLTGQHILSDGVPFALFSQDKSYINTYTFEGAYSSPTSRFTDNNSETAFQFVTDKSTGWPILISIDNYGLTTQIKSFINPQAKLTRGVDIAISAENSLVLLFNENQNANENSDIVIIKTNLQH